MNLAHLPDRAGPNELADQPRPFAGLSLIAHLGCHPSFLCRAADLNRLMHRTCQWFLAEDMFAQLQGHHRDDCMGMVRSGDHHGLDLFLRIKHLAEVAVGLGLREMCR